MDRVEALIETQVHLEPVGGRSAGEPAQARGILPPWFMGPLLDERLRCSTARAWIEYCIDTVMVSPF